MRNLGWRIWSMLLVYAVSLFGSGMTEPYLVLYLHDRNGMDLVLSGLIISMISISGVTAIPISGWLVSFIGSKNSLVVMLVMAGSGEALMAVFHQPSGLIAASILLGAGNAGAWNVFSSLLAGAVRKSQRTQVFGWAFAVQNFAAGAGAATGGWLLTSTGFPILFFADAVTFFLFAVSVHFILLNIPGSSPRNPNSHPVSHGVVFKDRAMIGIAVFYALFAALMSGLSMVIFPEWATGKEGAATSGVGLAFWANSLMIVIGQPFALRFLKGRKRTRMALLTSVLFAAGCLLIWISSILKAGIATVSGFVVAWMVIGLGEILLFPSLPALVNDLASDALRVRYNTIFNLSWQAGSIGGPLLSGWGMKSIGTLMFAGLMGFAILLSLFALRLERIVPNEANLN
ncbi:MAG TPA: MFS transporter [Bacillales bacterium]|nr:MFS transporter [Bacillales bacterium]